MFAYLDGTLQRYWLMGLLLLWGAFLFGGFVFGSGDGSHRMPTWTRMASSVTLVVAGWSWVLIGRNAPVDRFALFVAIGMSCGLLGDLVLAGVLPGGRNVLGGIAAFGVGHIFYIVGILQLSNAIGLDHAGMRWGGLILWLLVGLIGWYVVVFRGQEATVLHWAALPYALLLASTAGFATGMALQSALFVPLAVGAALFLFSDLVLAAELFSGLSFRSIGDVIWLMYGPGQMLIVFAVGAAQRWILTGS